MYAYPLISLVLYSLIRDRPNLLAITDDAVNAPIGLVAIGGFCLAGWMVLKPLFKQGLVSSWSLSRRLLTVGLAGILAISALVPLIIDAKPYGRRVVDADIGIYPEAGPDGNYRIYDQLPYKLLGNEWTTYFLGPLYSHGDPIAPWFNLHKKLEFMTLLFVLAITDLIVIVVILRGMRSILKKMEVVPGFA